MHLWHAPSAAVREYCAAHPISSIAPTSIYWMKCHIAALMENNVECSKHYWERINAEQSWEIYTPLLMGCGINQYAGTVHHDITDYFSCLTSIQTHLCLSISDHKYLSFPELLCAALLIRGWKGAVMEIGLYLKSTECYFVRSRGSTQAMKIADQMPSYVRKWPRPAFIW